MLRFKGGDFSAFEKIVHRNTQKVHSLIYRFMGPGGHVDDISQEVFLRVFRAADKYQPLAKFSTWLYRIVAHLSFNALKSRKRKRLVSLESTSTEDGETFSWDIEDNRFTQPHVDLDAEELGRKVAEAVSQLPDNQRIAIVLNKYENKNYEDIAQVLNISTMAVKSLLSRARGNLRITLKHYFEQG